jgi:hypothetical protein
MSRSSATVMRVMMEYSTINIAANETKLYGSARASARRGHWGLACFTVTIAACFWMFLRLVSLKDLRVALGRVSRQWSLSIMVIFPVTVVGSVAGSLPGTKILASFLGGYATRALVPSASCSSELVFNLAINFSSATAGRPISGVRNPAYPCSSRTSLLLHCTNLCRVLK